MHPEDRKVIEMVSEDVQFGQFVSGTSWLNVAPLIVPLLPLDVISFAVVPNPSSKFQ